MHSTSREEREREKEGQHVLNFTPTINQVDIRIISRKQVSPSAWEGGAGRTIYNGDGGATVATIIITQLNTAEMQLSLSPPDSSHFPKGNRRRRGRKVVHRLQGNNPIAGRRYVQPHELLFLFFSALFPSSVTRRMIRPISAQAGRQSVLSLVFNRNLIRRLKTMEKYTKYCDI